MEKKQIVPFFLDWSSNPHLQPKKPCSSNGTPEKKTDTYENESESENQTNVKTTN
jgi:hypothetical protein